MKKTKLISRLTSKKTCFLICLLSMIMILEGCSMSIFENWNLFNKQRVVTTDLAQYVQDLTGLTIDDLCEAESGDIEKDSSGDYANICLKLKDGGIEVMQERLETAGITPLSGTFTIPSYEDHEIAKKLKQEELVSCYPFYFDGKGRAKTRSAELYLTRDGEGGEYLYFFG